MNTEAARLLNAASVQARQEKAAARRDKVKALQEKGMSGPQIATELGVKLRTVYQDFAILKRQAVTSDNESDKGENR